MSLAAENSEWLEGVSGDPGGGPFVIIRLQFADGRVVKTDFDCNGCPAAQLAASGLATFAKGRTVEQLALIETSDLILLIGGLPEGKGQYADMAVEALQKAIARG